MDRIFERRYQQRQRQRCACRVRFAQALADTALIFKKAVDPAVLRDLSAALTTLKQPNAELDKLWSSSVAPEKESTEVSELEQFAAEYPMNREYQAALSMIKTGLYLKGSDKKTSKEFAFALVAEFIRLWNQVKSLENGSYGQIEKLEVSSEKYSINTCDGFDRFVKELDLERFIAFLKEYLYGNYYRYFIIPFCKYAPEKEIVSFISEIRSSKKGKHT